MAVHLGAIELRLRQLARAAETPATPVELTDVISSLRSYAGSLNDLGNRVGFFARIVEGDVPMAPAFSGGDPWGAAAIGTERADFGGPAVIPTANQLWRLATDGRLRAEHGEETTTYPQAMAPVPAAVLEGWESKEAAARRQKERDAMVSKEVLLIGCERCTAAVGKECRTATGWPAERPHAVRQRTAEQRVDARLGRGSGLVAVPDA